MSKCGVQRIKLTWKKGSDVPLSSRRLTSSQINREFKKFSREALIYCHIHESRYLNEEREGKIEKIFTDQIEFDFNSLGSLTRIDFTLLTQTRQDCIDAIIHRN